MAHVMRPASALAPETRQTCRILCKASLVTQVCRAMPSVQRQPSQRRSYKKPAKKTYAEYTAPKTRKTDTAAPVKAPPLDPPKPVLEFSSKDIPPMSVWESVMGLAPGDLTVADLDATARKYCASAIKGRSTWKGQLLQEQDLYTLHYTAILLLAGPMGPFWHLGAHMLRTASDLDYNPSTISLLRLVLRTTILGPESVKYATALHGPLTKFRLLVLHERNNPDVLTVDGVLRARRGDVRGALECFDRAIAVAKTAGDAFAPAPTQEELKHYTTILPQPVRKPTWAMESMCYLEKGRLCLQQGKIADAEAAFRVAAEELDMAAAYLELGKMMPIGSPERENYLLRAITTGKTDAIPLLSVFSEDKPVGPARDPKEDQRWANEWRFLASKSSEEEGTSGSSKPAPQEEGR